MERFHRWLDTDDTLRLVIALLLGMLLGTGVNFATMTHGWSLLILPVVLFVTLSRIRYIHKGK